MLADQDSRSVVGPMKQTREKDLRHRPVQPTPVSSTGPLLLVDCQACLTT
ncbi:hypothetical protein OG777_15070 [Micromonospora peucetia]|uniref:Uncharacterized protein n=1 Tax=Micromonospora peucetia TaxID=47871 RepID=A0ABZ1EBC1_9ACTN|nr:hypothetical protein [Micromonospora peucetia]MCX4388243.1 hypothetical protein [Micromonospora peucetia]WSA31078.1 hypothetical protein OIE14_23405 [Micromonospora peucetia]